MKLVVAVIQPTKLAAVHEALKKIEVTRLTICDAQAFAAAPPLPIVDRLAPQSDFSSAGLPSAAMFRGEPCTASLLRKVVLEIIVNDDFLERTVETILHTARTGAEGAFGDGKIFVLPAEQAIQIDDGLRGPGAV